ncbi:hypothetical protein G7Y89_g2404 [Cudoniella acicularis]|uniref:RxLR effector protein n=1 Tax=Cudoniella acicularis TaxID=354080 RepID=A0A8H4RWC0_9HELO|nr:hypothetical protein G7Y89_g2404 [Cudoniella acicularis]
MRLFSSLYLLVAVFAVSSSSLAVRPSHDAAKRFDPSTLTEINNDDVGAIDKRFDASTLTEIDNDSVGAID